VIVEAGEPVPRSRGPSDSGTAGADERQHRSPVLARVRWARCPSLCATLMCPWLRNRLRRP